MNLKPYSIICAIYTFSIVSATPGLLVSHKALAWKARPQTHHRRQASTNTQAPEAPQTPVQSTQSVDPTTPLKGFHMVLKTAYGKINDTDYQPFRARIMKYGEKETSRADAEIDLAELMFRFTKLIECSEEYKNSAAPIRLKLRDEELVGRRQHLINFLLDLNDNDAVFALKRIINRIDPYSVKKFQEDNPEEVFEGLGQRSERMFRRPPRARIHPMLMFLQAQPRRRNHPSRSS